MDLVELEGNQIATGYPRRTILAVNAIHTSYEAMVSRSLIDGSAPFSTRTRAGVIAGSTPTMRLTAAEMFDRVSTEVGWRVSPQDMSYALTAIMLLRTATPPEGIPQRMLGRPTAALFRLPHMQDGLSPATVAAMEARLCRCPRPSFGKIVLGQNFLPHQSLVDGAVRRGNAVFFSSDVPAGIVASGPYARLPPGRYVAFATFEVERAISAGDQISSRGHFQLWGRCARGKPRFRGRTVGRSTDLSGCPSDLTSVPNRQIPRSRSASGVRDSSRSA